MKCMNYGTYHEVKDTMGCVDGSNLSQQKPEDISG